MWKDFSSDYIKNNRLSSLSVRLSAFISALLLSLLCGLFYNAWKYEVERIELEEGAWHSRIAGRFDQNDVEAVQHFANVNKVTISNDASGLLIIFDDMKDILTDTPHIARSIGAGPEQISYNHALMAMYLIRDPNDKAPRLLFPMFVVILLMASFSLIAIIHNAFAVSMNARIHQFGILSSIGAAPRQIRTCLMQEAFALCAVWILAGNLLGIAASMGLSQLSNILLGNDIPGRHKAVPGCHPLVLILTLGITAITIAVSAWLPARKLSRLSPLEAIRNTGGLQLKRPRKVPVLTFLFGVEGELAQNALTAQKKALRTASLSLISAFLAFTIMQCFFTTSVISTKETYFERYQDTWDIMAVVKNTSADEFSETEAIRKLGGVESAVVYQKASAKRIVTEAEMSEEMKSFGGFSHAPDGAALRMDDGWLVNAPLLILDDDSFLEYCRQIGAEPRLDGAVVRNLIRDVTNPDFRHPVYMSYLKTQPADTAVSNAVTPDNPPGAVSILRQQGNSEITAELPILAYTQEVPVLREEYASTDYYELVHFIPISLWKEIKGLIGGAGEDLYIRVIGRKNVSLEELDTLQSQIDQLIGQSYTLESENRIREYELNNRQIQGIRTAFGSFCVLLAIIGIGDVFSNTLGFVHQRKREFARYMSIGMTPEEIRKMFCIEALILAGRPVLITIPLAVIAVGYMLKMSYLGVDEFMAEAPFVPIVIFMVFVLASVASAYALAWRNVRKICLAEVLKNDTMI
jgi:putative ABC transport system permease protein